MELSEIKNKELDIKKWLAFNDNEKGLIHYFINQYFLEYKKDITKEDCYSLGILGSQTQYELRCLNSRISGDLKGVNIESNNLYIKKITSYNGLIDYVVNAFNEYFNNLTYIKLYEYQQNNKSSYSNLSESEIKNIENLIDVIKK